MKSRITCLALLLFLWGCGSSNNSSSGISISISPTSATLTTSATQQFTAKVQNASNTGVNWQVNGFAGGNSTIGTISSSGLYTAPATIPPSGSVTITAVSAANSGETATATVTFAAPIVVSPATVSVVATMTQQFTATVSFSSNKAVNWQVNGVGGGNSTVGTINSSGLYTAPNTPPTPNPVTVTAIAQADNSHTASATVTITPPPIVISPASAVLAAAAQQSFTATILSNTVHPTWAVTCRSTALGGCGSITSDGTYTAPLAPPPGAQVTITASMPDNSGAPESVTATIQFSNATLTGRYIITLADDVGHVAPSQVGTLACDGSGHITGGVIDSTDAPGAPISVTSGTYTVGTDGRGTATVQTSAATLQFQFVLSSNSQGYLVRTDSGANQAAGTIDLQNTSGTTILNGAYALALSGFTTGATPVLFGEAGSVLLSNTGAVTGGVTDVETNLTLQTGTVSGGSYTQASSSGRGTLTFTATSGSATLAYYAIDNTRVKLVSIDGSTTAAGELVLQPQGPFSNASFKGPYAFSVSGLKTGNFFGVIGVFSPDGSGTIKNQQFDGITQTTFDFNPGAYAVTDPQTGRTTATWTANGGTKLAYILYPRNDGGFVILENDGIYGGTGVAIPQANPTELNVLSLGGAFALSLQGSELATPSVGESITGHLAATTSSTLVGSIDSVKSGQGVAFGLNLTSLNFAPQRYAFGISSTALTGGPVIAYRIDDDQAFCIDSDGSRILVGAMQRQF